jgi:exonuclease III
VKIATFNVNGINGRLARVIEWLQEAQPDVACLQELKTSDDKFPAAAIERAGYGAIWHGQKSWNGVAILARDLHARRNPPRLAGRQWRQPQPLHRGGRERNDRRFALPAERQSAARTQVRL